VYTRNRIESSNLSFTAIFRKTPGSYASRGFLLSESLEFVPSGTGRGWRLLSQVCRCSLSYARLNPVCGLPMPSNIPLIFTALFKVLQLLGLCPPLRGLHEELWLVFFVGKEGIKGQSDVRSFVGDFVAVDLNIFLPQGLLHERWLPISMKRPGAGCQLRLLPYVGAEPAGGCFGLAGQSRRPWVGANAVQQYAEQHGADDGGQAAGAKPADE
jgi:hypothetical protein